MDTASIDTASIDTASMHAASIYADPPALFLLMKGLTSLGDTSFLLVFFSLGYWLVHRRVFARVFVLLTASVLVNSVLKAIFQVPRPAGQALVHADGWSFPSGHATISAAIWPALAFYLLRHRRRQREEGQPEGGQLEGNTGLVDGLVFGAALLLVVGIACSRVYLGVHTPTDVTWGAIFGLLLAVLGVRLGEAPPAAWQRLGADGQAAAVALAVALVLALLPRNGDSVAAVAGGGLVGFWVGASLARLRFADYGAWDPGRRLGVAILGLGGAIGLRVGLKPLLAALPSIGLPALSMEAAHTARFLLIGLWVAFLAPRLFVALGLYQHPVARGRTRSS